MIDGTFDGKPSVITKGLQSFYPLKNFQGCPQKKRKHRWHSIIFQIHSNQGCIVNSIFN